LPIRPISESYEDITIGFLGMFGLSAFVAEVLSEFVN